LRIDRKGVAVQIADLERGDLGAPQPDLAVTVPIRS